MKLIPNLNKLVVKRQERATTSAGGIHIPDAAQERPGYWRGEVLANHADDPVANANQDSKPTFENGSVVLVMPYVGIEVEEGGEKLVIIDVSDVLAMVER